MGTLTFLPAPTLTGTNTFEGQQIIDITSTEAFLVRRNGASGNIFIVDTTNGNVNLPDDITLALGTSDDAKFIWETADANANCLILALPTGGAINVPLFVIGDASLENKDLGFFNGITSPAIAVVSADEVNYSCFQCTGATTVIEQSGAGNFVFRRSGTAHHQLSVFGSGENVFNEQGIDIDSRFETDNQTHAFHIDAALDVTRFGGAGVAGQYFTITELARTSGTPTAVTITGAGHAGVTAATEAVGINLNQSATKTWAAGAGPLATQREVVVQAPTYAGNAAGALTITNASTVYVSGAPIQGANMTLTNKYAVFVDAGTVRLDGRVLFAQGADVGSANDLTLGSDGNVFEITGAVQINAITIAGWQNGSMITMLFTSNPVVKHNTAGGAGTAVMLLAGAGDFASTAGDTITLVLSEIGGTQAWREVGRAVI